MMSRRRLSPIWSSLDILSRKRRKMNLLEIQLELLELFVVITGECLLYVTDENLWTRDDYSDRGVDLED